MLKKLPDCVVMKESKTLTLAFLKKIHFPFAAQEANEVMGILCIWIFVFSFGRV